MMTLSSGAKAVFAAGLFFAAGCMNRVETTKQLADGKTTSVDVLTSEIVEHGSAPPDLPMSIETSGLDIALGEPLQDCIERLQMKPTLSLSLPRIRYRSLRWGNDQFVSPLFPGKLIDVDWVLSSDSKACVNKYCLFEGQDKAKHAVATTPSQSTPTSTEKGK